MRVSLIVATSENGVIGKDGQIPWKLPNDLKNTCQDMDAPSDWWLLDDPDRVEENINGFREEYQGAPVRIHLLDRKGGDMDEWPADLRVREFPAVRP